MFLSSTQHYSTPTINSVNLNWESCSIRKVGFGYCWILPNNSGSSLISIRCSRLFYQAGRSTSSMQDHSRSSKKLCIWNIVRIFEVLQHIVINNSSQITGGKFIELCEELKIKVCHSSIYCPRGNGQIEIKNKAIIGGLKKRWNRQRKDVPSYYQRSKPG